ncbi:MAG: hypothetical protein IJ188_03020 [Clostridia bacterium]|nr:hypothetical protein [Clostridia bacterium]
MKYERRHKRVDRKWRKLEPKVHFCPDCCGSIIALSDSLDQRFKRYNLVCETCHYRGPTANTIRGAIRKWNRDHGSYGTLME